MPHTPWTNFITDDNHGAWVTTVAAILLTWMLLFLLMRAAIRVRFNGPWGHDDYTVTAGSLIALCQSICIFIAVADGFGRRSNLLSASQLESTGKAIYATEILYIIASCLSKCSTSLLIARLTRARRHLLASHIITSMSALWGIVGILLVAFRCNLSHPWSLSDSSCVNIFSRWLGIGIVGSIIETMLFGLAIYLVWALQMGVRLKVIVVVAFSCRLFIIVTTGIRLHYLRPSFLSGDPTFDGVYAVILTQVDMHYALMAATIPCTKPFIGAFYSGYITSGEYTAKDSKYAHEEGYILHSSSLERGERIAKKGTVRRNAPTLRPDAGEIITVIEHSPNAPPPDEDPSMEACDPHQMIIRQTRDWEVSYEPADHFMSTLKPL